MAPVVPPGEAADMTWIPSAVLALVCFSVALLIIGRIGARMDAVPLTAWMLGLQAVAGCIQALPSGARALPPAGAWWPLLLAAGLCYAGNVGQTLAVSRAPNPGFALAIIGSSTVVVAVAAAVIGGAPLGGVRAVGIALCAAGVGIVVLAR